MAKGEAGGFCRIAEGLGVWPYEVFQVPRDETRWEMGVPERERGGGRIAGEMSKQDETIEEIEDERADETNSLACTKCNHYNTPA